ncbi:DUF2589 domain-containing protein [Bacteroides uniformis]|uniref:DUF2589 domain-containing protein n=1 Tax=Bacteroides uniformis TaxID=820 RepID=A0AAW6GX82_BACUN|nr:DUF2589 domain-containing protein [Bacteroides uniformis]MDC1882076.1 DUF2589 domain-containing protein [Bacteroides uniformis]MDC1886019.1 DUF2589 domain-containing protein [Bacteroides uniformis]
MISFKLFVEAIHRAVNEAADSLAKRNEELLDKYFYETFPTNEPQTGKQVLNPKMINLEYPMLDSEGRVIKGEIQVPLITIVPVSATKIEKATLTAEFELSVADEEVQINFFDTTQHKSDTAYGKLEVVISPQDIPKGLELLISGYNNILKRQIS